MKVLTTKINSLLKKIEGFNTKIVEVRKQLNPLILQRQNECKHPIEFVVEIPYRGETSYSYLEKPIRICEICGLAEEGWGSGYKNLHRSYYGDLRSCPREQLWDKAYTLYLQGGKVRGITEENNEN